MTLNPELIKALPTQPVYCPAHEIGNVAHAYIDSVQAINTPAQLKAHLLRWRGLWDLFPTKDWGLLAKKLQTADIPLERVLAKLKIMRRKEEPEIPPGKTTQLAIEIILPGPLAQCHFIAKAYGVTGDLVLIQAHGVHDAYDYDYKE